MGANKEGLMTSTIVCGIDHSDHARAAARVAAALAQRLELRLSLVYALPAEAPPPVTTSPPGALFDRDAARHDAEHAVARLLAEVLDETGLDDADGRVEHGSAPERLTAAAEQDDAAFLVVGTRGDGAARAALLGSVSMAIAQTAPCPVIVVPPAVARARRDALAGRAVVCGVHGPEDRQVVHGAARLAAALSLPLTVAHVVDPEDGGETTFEETQTLLAPLILAARKITSPVEEPVLMAGDPAQRLTALADERPAAVLVVGTRGRGPLRSAILGSVSRSLACSATVPVLIDPLRSAPAMGSAPHGRGAPAART
jgi:nucleotide-binding universal stress UspA family protein